jgi:hypothetical protein
MLSHSFCKTHLVFSPSTAIVLFNTQGTGLREGVADLLESWKTAALLYD